MVDSIRRRAGAALHVAQGIDERYRTAIHLWAMQHHANHHDMTPEQDQRYRLCNRLVDAGLDPKRIVFARRRFRSGALNDNKR